MNKLTFMLVFIALFLAVKLKAQRNFALNGQSISALSKQEEVLSVPTSFAFLGNTYYPFFLKSKLNTGKNKQHGTPLNSPNLLKQPAAWKYEDLAFFCKIEVKMEKKANLPIKFRIGEVQQVERMEGKLKQVE